MNPILYRKTKWLRFFIVGRKPKTVCLEVRNTSKQILGTIAWYGPWRQYCFTPTLTETEIIFNNGCLKDIVDVLTHLNDEQKAGKIGRIP